MEYNYANGTCLIEQIEDTYISAEVFPNKQSKDSFEGAEYNTVAKIETWANSEITQYDFKVPSNMTEEEQKEYYNTVVKFAKKLLTNN